MHKRIFFLSVVLLALVSDQRISACQTYNTVRSFTARKPIATRADMISDSRTTTEVLRVTEYVDGFGRPVQTVSKQTSALNKDGVEMHVYDTMGREVQQYLPFVSNVAQTGDVTNDGNFKSDALQQQSAFNSSQYPGETYYYAKMDYENSPLNRRLKVYAPGSSWVGASRGTSGQYLVNTATDNVRVWNIAQTAGSLPTSTTAYGAGKLYKEITTDEKGVQSIQYQNKDGKTILKKVQLTASADNGNGSPHAGWLCTYYVYDDNNNLRFIITPKAVQAIDGSWTISEAIAGGLCFRYEYDSKDRAIIKKVPGAGETQMVYDLRNRLVFSQDGNQKMHNQWAVAYYDGLDRPIETGLYTDASATRQSLQNIMDTATTSFVQVTSTADLVVDNRNGNKPVNYIARNSITFNPGFSSGTNDDFTAYIDPNATTDDVSKGLTNNPRPPINPGLVTPLTYTYYDDYAWTGHQAFQSSYLSKVTDASNPYAESPTTYSSKTRGMVTGTKVKVLGSTSAKWLTSTFYYDDKGRALQILSSNNTGGTDIVTNKYDFSGTLLSSYVVNHNSQSTITPETRMLTENKYDSGGRLLTVTKTINDQAATQRVVATNTYDELNQLKTQTLGNNLETLTYDYNIRGWLTGINRNFTQSGNTDNYFGMELGYDKSATKSGTTTFTPRYDGNISGEIWKSKGDNVPRKYDFTYDNASRLKEAAFIQNSSGTTWNNATVNFSVNNLTYDANGNIMSMRQYGLKGSSSSPIDELAYSYEGNSNKLLKVTDTASDPNTTLGDFHDGTAGGNDYAYDTNGNLTSDANKKISSITYNDLNLPETITITGKGTIRFVYDAAGNKLQKIVTDNTTNPSRTIVTDYADGFVYRHIGSTAHDTLQFFPTENGRVRYIPSHGSTAAAYVYDYFIQDHLGNVRMILTEQTDFTHYVATMEQQNGQKEDALFYNIDNTRESKPVDYPQDNTTSPNAAVARLNGDDPDKRVGPSIILKVMAGDTIQAAVKAFYRQQATKKNNAGLPAEQILAGLLQAFTAPAMQAATLHSAGLAPDSRLAGPGLTTSDLQQLKDGAPEAIPEDKPKAYLNYVFFDNQLNFVGDGSGVKQVSGDPGELETLSSGKVVAKKDGYVYIYTSNESGQDVFFDNLGVLDITGPILEETHYYPDGLAMAAISTVAPLKIANKFRYQGKELQDKEFADNSGLEWYDFEARYYDPQIGRWWSQDPDDQFFSPYLAMGNNWVVVTDPDGHFVILAIVAAAVVNGLVNVASQALKGNVHNLSQGFEYFGVGALAGAAFVTGGPALAGSIQVVGNKAVQYLNGQWSPDDIHNAFDVANLALDVWTDYMTPELGANLGQALINPEWFTTVSGGGHLIETISRKGWMEVGRSAPYEVVSTQLGSRAAAEGAELAAAEAMEGAAKGGTTVLGKYPDYINLASELGAKRFNIPTNIWNKMTAAEQWGANVKFLDRMIARGDKIVLSNRVTDINKVTGAFRKELDYLMGKGYKLSSDGLQMIK